MSVPYSPTSQDLIKRDPMNLPPHHLTQWNQKSLTKFGEAVGLVAHISTDDEIASSSLAHTVYWYILSNVEGGRATSLLSNALRILTSPRLFIRCALFVITREKVGGKIAGNTAFAMFKSQQSRKIPKNARPLFGLACCSFLSWILKLDTENGVW